MKPNTVRLRFVPSYRWSYTDWVDQMRRESLAAFAQIPGVEIICPQPAPDGKTSDPLLGLTARGLAAGRASLLMKKPAASWWNEKRFEV